MVTTKNGTGIARIATISLAVLLLTGVIGSLVMGFRARGAALDDIREQATAITDASLGLVLKPDDLGSVASGSRISTLSDQIGRVVIDPSDFDSVTLWSPTADILYSTEEGRIGNRLAGESERIRSALREEPQIRTNDGTVSVMVPMRRTPALRAASMASSTVRYSTLLSALRYSVWSSGLPRWLYVSCSRC